NLDQVPLVLPPRKTPPAATLERLANSSPVSGSVDSEVTRTPSGRPAELSAQVMPPSAVTAIPPSVASQTRPAPGSTATWLTFRFARPLPAADRQLAPRSSETATPSPPRMVTHSRFAPARVSTAMLVRSGEARPARWYEKLCPWSSEATQP